MCCVLLLRNVWEIEREKKRVSESRTYSYKFSFLHAASKWANRALPCLFQRFYKCYPGPRGSEWAVGVRGRWGFATNVRAAAKATLRRAPSRPITNMTVASRHVSSALTAACLAKRSSMYRTISDTSTRRSWSSATRSSRTSRAAMLGTRD